jgi:hypothetical protein
MIDVWWHGLCVVAFVKFDGSDITKTHISPRRVRKPFMRKKFASPPRNSKPNLFHTTRAKKLQATFL